MITYEEAATARQAAERAREQKLEEILSAFHAFATGQADLLVEPRYQPDPRSAPCTRIRLVTR